MPEIDLRPEDVFRLKKVDDGCCWVSRCGNTRKPSGSRYCRKHEMELYRKRNPTKSAYNQIKYKARQRKINFILSYEEFLEVIKDTGYINERGVTSEHLQLDRIDATKGYEVNNLVVVAADYNIAKGNKERRTLGYKIALFERKGLEDLAAKARLELQQLEEDLWFDPGNLVNSYEPTENEPF